MKHGPPRFKVGSRIRVRPGHVRQGEEFVVLAVVRGLYGTVYEVDYEPGRPNGVFLLLHEREVIPASGR